MQLIIFSTQYVISLLYYLFAYLIKNTKFETKLLVEEFYINNRSLHKYINRKNIKFKKVFQEIANKFCSKRTIEH